MIFKPQVVSCHHRDCPADTGSADGVFDCDVCSDVAQRCCYRDACDACAGHRRAQAEASCDADELQWRTADINSACCDDPSEDCSPGYPTTCMPDCAALFLPFWDECRSALGKGSQNYEPVVALCEAVTSTTPSLADQLNVVCSDGTPAADCVPACSESLHGNLMLLNIEGHDSKFACELRHGLYSWVGPAVRTA